MPDPRAGETRAEFVSRYMGDAKAVRDYPDEKQRYAVAVSTWERRHIAKQLDETSPGGTDGHRHSYLGGATRTGAEPGHDHEVRPGAVRTELANGHDHALPAEGYRTRATIKSVEGDRFELVGRVEKLDEEQKLASGWFSVIEEDGEPVIDKQGDVIEEATLLKAAHRFVLDVRAGKVMHRGRRVADLVDSLVFTRDIQKALGIDLHKVGWFGTMKVRDDAVWERIKSGELNAFSIGGTGRRRPVKD